MQIVWVSFNVWNAPFIGYMQTEMLFPSNVVKDAQLQDNGECNFSFLIPINQSDAKFLLGMCEWQQTLKTQNSVLMKMAKLRRPKKINKQDSQMGV